MAAGRPQPLMHRPRVSTPLVLGERLRCWCCAEGRGGGGASGGAGASAAIVALRFLAASASVVAVSPLASDFWVSASGTKSSYCPYLLLRVRK